MREWDYVWYKRLRDLSEKDPSMGNGKKIKKKECLYINSPTPKLQYNDPAIRKAESEVLFFNGLYFLAKKHWINGINLIWLSSTVFNAKSISNYTITWMPKININLIFSYSFQRSFNDSFDVVEAFQFKEILRRTFFIPSQIYIFYLEI